MKITRLFTFVCLMFISLSFAQEKFTILIDAGHGGNDPGTKHKDILEKDITLDIANLIGELNENENLDIHLIRNDDNFLELKQRAEIANQSKADLLISLHINNAPSEKLKGMEIYISPKNSQFEESKNYATKFVLLSDKKVKIKEANFLLLRESEIPAMTLELGYISNEGDFNYLKSKRGKKEIATKILKYLDSLAG